MERIKGGRVAHGVFFPVSFYQMLFNAFFHKSMKSIFCLHQVHQSLVCNYAIEKYTRSGGNVSIGNEPDCKGTDVSTNRLKN